MLDRKQIASQLLEDVLAARNGGAAVDLEKYPGASPDVLAQAVNDDTEIPDVIALVQKASWGVVGEEAVKTIMSIPTEPGPEPDADAVLAAMLGRSPL